MRTAISSSTSYDQKQFSPAFRPWFFALILSLASISLAYGQQNIPQASSAEVPISATEFSRMVQDFSEPGGYFHSDNFTSNETAYLHILSKLKELGVTGGAYLGVGPEQNFTYIASIRPQIAFIVDIRRQAVIQHLMYKAIFHLSPDRAHFLSLLFSKPLPKNGEENKFSVEELLKYIGATPTTKELHASNLSLIQKAIEESFHFPLNAEDVKSLGYVYDAFWRANLHIGFRFGSSDSYGWGFPDLADLIMATDQKGDRRNFLAHDDDYQFVRTLQEENRVVPVVGDFAGTKAITNIASYLRKNGYTVGAFYTSNVEQFLFENDVFNRYAENIGKLPISDKSVFIRAARLNYSHPAAIPGVRMPPLLQKISAFLDDYRQNLITDYGSLVGKDYIAPTQPDKEAPQSPTH